MNGNIKTFREGPTQLPCNGLTVARLSVTQDPSPRWATRPSFVPCVHATQKQGNSRCHYSKHGDSRSSDPVECSRDSKRELRSDVYPDRSVRGTR
eukprot:465934-Hanusia_phi.AAC.1